jgi:hypothetical protein
MDAKKLMAKYPGRCPIIVTVISPLPALDKTKYLVPHDLTMSGFQNVLRRRTTLKPEHAVFLFVGDGVLAPGTQTVGTVYKEFKNPETSLLHVEMRGESTFG